jgi:hypothetical protein
MLLESLISEHPEINFVGQARGSLVDSSVVVVFVVVVIVVIIIFVVVASWSVIAELIGGSLVFVPLGAVSALDVGSINVGHIGGFGRSPRRCTAATARCRPPVSVPVVVVPVPVVVVVVDVDLEI